ncbi:DUF4357 domain-containing protein [Streptomyces sp. Lzd4kr]|nr:DUF4357 domain-containing protein [Streptomyces sp. Lzd4kr]
MRVPPLPLGEAETLRILRSKLELVARARGLINWETLVSRAGASPVGITPEERVRLLIAVDHPRADGKPVLSALVKPALGPDAPAPYFADVLAGLGWRSDLSEAKVVEIRERERRTAYTVAESTPARQRSSASASEANADTAHVLNEARLVARLREHLEVVAKGRGIIKWSTLLKKQRIAPSTMSDEDRVRLLAAVDRSYVPGRRMLSALVKADGQTPGPAPFFGDVLRELGWKPDAGTPTVEAAWRAAVDRAYARGTHLAGSPGRPDVVPSFPVRMPSSYRLRQRLIEDDIFVESETWPGWMELIEDVECNSPSAAAEILVGRSANGWLEWKTADGHPLSDYLDQVWWGPNRAWLVRGSNASGLDLVRRLWLPKGLVTLRVRHLRQGVEQDISKDRLRAAVEEDYASTATYNQKVQLVEEMHMFLSRMRPGDTMCTISGGRLYVGKITGDAEQLASEDGRSDLRRPVDWADNWHAYEDLPEALQQKLSAQHDVVDLTAVSRPRARPSSKPSAGTPFE